MTRRFALGWVLIALIATTGSVLGAQQAANAPITDASKIDPTKNLVDGFERSLLLAIDSAAGKLNNRVREALPSVPIRLAYETPPIATGALLPESSAIFHVLIPAIADADLKLTQAALAWQRVRAAQQVANDPNRVSATTIVPADPANAIPLIEPDKEYTTLVKQALVDAILDHSLSLPIPAGQNLTVIADELQTQPSPFNPRSRTLILQLKGEDLIALRENRITRDEAKSRIRESKYPN